MGQKLVRLHRPRFGGASDSWGDAMTLSTMATTLAYAGNGATTVFPVPFVFFDADELQVIERVIATGAETVKELSAHYTVSGGNGATGTVTALSAPPATVEWHIRRVTAKVQATAYVPNDSFPAASHERALDRLAAQGQEDARDLGFALRFPPTDAPPDPLPSASERAGLFLAFDGSGAPALSAGGAAEAASAAASAAAASAAAGSAAGAAAGASASAAAASASAGAAATSAANAQAFGGAALVGTSTTSLAIGTGAKVFATQAGKGWTLGTRLRAASDDGMKFMEGAVTAYAGTSLTLEVDLVGDSGTHADWNIGVAGERGAQGAAGAGSGDLVSTNNLSDVANSGTARSNLGAAAAATAIAAGTGLTGGGDLSANRTLSLNIPGLTAEASVAGGDELVIYDASAAAHRRMTRTNFLGGVGGETNTASNVGSAGQSLFKQKAGVDLQFRKLNVTTQSSGSGNGVSGLSLSIAVVSDVVTITLDVTRTTFATPGGGGGA